MPAPDRLKARKRPRQERSRSTVDVLLRAAAQVFAARGYAATTTNHIAARAGVSIGSLYEYFPSKDALLVALMEARTDSLTSLVYNVTSFSPTAGELAALVRRAFPTGRITFEPDDRRQVIVDSWPEDVDDTRARRDWGFRPAYDLERAFSEYLLPNIGRRAAPA